jgi:hypothetical protein
LSPYRIEYELTAYRLDDDELVGAGYTQEVKNEIREYGGLFQVRWGECLF